MAASKRIAVVGAGASGLAAIKCCLDEGLDVVCFERTDSIGGLWHYTQEAREGQACVMKSTVINTSKEMMCYSDFPIPKEFAVFMHNTSVMKYFHMYADNFKLKEQIRFNTEVLSIKPSPDNDTTGRWDITTRDRSTGKERPEQFDGVLICTGHHACPNMPTFPGMEKFRGSVLHSHDYKTPAGYEDKRVVVVGIGNSGGDAAVELSRHASQVFLSTRSGSWVWNRMEDQGAPVDGIMTTRYVQGISDVFPRIAEHLLMRKLNKRFDHSKFSLKPNHGPFQQHPNMTDDLPNRILAGKIKVKSNIEKFTENGVQFDDGTFEDNIDAVVLATGYIFGFPFLDKKVLEVKDNRVNLYKYMFPPDRRKQTLAIIGCFQPLGAIMPLSEIQCRLATRVFKEKVVLPPAEQMWEDIRMKQTKMAQRYVKSMRHTIQVDYIQYMDELAILHGCKPDLGRLCLTDPKLAWQCFFGPCTPCQYRLMGPGAWEGAREAVLTTWDRIEFPLKTRGDRQVAARSPGYFLLLAAMMALIATQSCGCYRQLLLVAAVPVFVAYLLIL